MPLVTALLGQPDEEHHETLPEYINRAIAKAEHRLMILRKAKAELEAIGADKVVRILHMMATDEDPDNPKSTPVVKVGPHGPGCECRTEDEELSGEEEKVN